MTLTASEKFVIVRAVEQSGVLVLSVTPDLVDRLNDLDSVERFQYDVMCLFAHKPLLLVWLNVDEERKHLVRTAYKDFHTVREVEYQEFLTDPARTKALITELVSSGRAAAA